MVIIMSQSSINPGFHSEQEKHKDLRPEKDEWSQSSINPGFHSELNGHPCTQTTARLVAIQYQSWFSFRADKERNLLYEIDADVAIQYQSWFSFRAISRGNTDMVVVSASQSSINPGFHSESRFKFDTKKQ